jgi:hypothetical protein
MYKLIYWKEWSALCNSNTDTKLYRYKTCVTYTVLTNASDFFAHNTYKLGHYCIIGVGTSDFDASVFGLFSS